MNKWLGDNHFWISNEKLAITLRSKGKVNNELRDSVIKNAKTLYDFKQHRLMVWILMFQYNYKSTSFASILFGSVEQRKWVKTSFAILSFYLMYSQNSDNTVMFSIIKPNISSKGWCFYVRMCTEWNYQLCI